MNASICPFVTSSPFATPAASPIPSATQAPSATVGQPTPIGPAIAFSAMIVTPDAKAASEPTDRSMLPVVMTKVAPTAMMPVKAVRVSTLAMFPAPRNAGLASAPITTSAARARNGPACTKLTRSHGVWRSAKVGTVSGSGGTLHPRSQAQDGVRGDRVARQRSRHPPIPHHADPVR